MLTVGKDHSLNRNISGKLNHSTIRPYYQIMQPKLSWLNWSIVKIQFDRNQVLPIRMSTQFRYNRGAQMMQYRFRFLDKKDRVCAIAARHRPSARPTRRRLATGIVLSSTHHTCGRIPRTHTQLRTSRPPCRARIRAGGVVCGCFWALRAYRYTNSDCFHRQLRI